MFLRHLVNVSKTFLNVSKTFWKGHRDIFSCPYERFREVTFSRLC